MCYDNFDSGFGMMPGFDPGFGSPVFDGSGCFPTSAMDMGFNGGFSPSFNSDFGMGLPMPMTCGYSPAPFGCNPVSMDFGGNLCIDGIPITPSTPPAWMTARAAHAEMHLNQLDMQLNDPNLWMRFIPQGALNPPVFDPSAVDWQSMPVDVPEEPSAVGMPFTSDLIAGFNSGMNQSQSMDLNQTTVMEDSASTMWNGEDVLPCGLTKSQYDQNMSKYQALLADCERQLENCDPFHSAQRAMIQNNIDRINRNIRDLDKPLGKI